MPETEGKIAYDKEARYVIFRVQDRYVRAVVTEYQESVCRDSCVKFFFAPNSEVSKGYFNLEMNCGGTALFASQEASREGIISMPESDHNQVKIAHSLPGLVDLEIKTAVTWTVKYRIPLALLEKYSSVTSPGPGVTWQANFYKCADGTSHLHWLTGARADFPQPQFHLPEFFGTLEFE
ncbi:MAG: diguanylate cyclase [Caldiserica bacterium]|nr:diguanylate cyclase [Caldisericota bacterium]